MIPALHRWLSAAKAVATNGRARSAWATRLLNGGAIHQDSSDTRLDRYPQLFAACQALLGKDGAHRILSFGCSSGEEVVTLGRYFPAARIVGAEINRWRLADCRRLPPRPEVTFIASNDATITAHGPYDAIFCMAVLQRRPQAAAALNVGNIADIYPFAHFDAQIGFLVDRLAPDGLLVVQHAQYLVSDARAAVRLEPVTDHCLAEARGPRFDPAGALISPPPIIARIFRKTALGDVGPIVNRAGDPAGTTIPQG